MEKFDSIFWNVLGDTNIPPKKSWYYVKFGFNMADSVSTVPMVQKKKLKNAILASKKKNRGLQKLHTEVNKRNWWAKSHRQNP